MNKSSSINRCYKRLEKEKEDLEKHYSDSLVFEVDKDNDLKWYVTFKGAKGSLYEGEEFKLQFKFGPEFVII